MTRRVSMPFAESGKEEVRVLAARRVQAIAYSNFNARRNSLKIEQYFNQIKDKRTTIISKTVLVILVVSIFFLTGYFIDKHSNQLIIDNAVIGIHSTYNTYYQNVAHMLFEPFCFAGFLTSYHRFIVANENSMSLEDFRAMERTLKRFTDIGTNITTYIKIYFRYNFSMGIESLRDRSLRLIYFTLNDAENFRSYYWTTDSDGINSSYPFNGTEFFYNNNQHSQWVSLSLNSSIAQWTDIFFSSFSYGSVPTVAVMKSGNVNNHPRTTVSAMSSILLETIQNSLYSQQSTPKSRFALTTGGGTLIGVTGDDTPMDKYNNVSVGKDLTQLHDQMWKSVSKNILISKGKNFSVYTKINNSECTMYLIQSTLPEIYEVDWHVYGLFCLEDLYGNIYVNFVLIYAIWAIALVVIILLKETLLYHVNNYERLYQTKLFSKNSGNIDYNNKHMSGNGLEKAVYELKKFFKTHTDSHRIVKDTHEVIELLTTPIPSLYFDSAKFVASIKDERIREKFAERYCPNYKILSDRRVSYKQGPAYEINESSEILDFEKEAISKRKNIVNFSKNELETQIIDTFIRLNDIDKLLDEHKLIDTVKELMEEMNEDEKWLLLDSINLFELLFDFRLKLIISEPRISIAVPLCILAFHKVTVGGNRRSVFLNKQKPMDEALQLITTRIDCDDSVSHSANIIAAAGTSMDILPTLSILTVFTDSAVNGEVLTPLLSMEAGRVLLHASEASFFFNTGPSEERGVEICYTRVFADGGVGAAACIKKEAIAPMAMLLKRLAGSEFIGSFKEP